MNARGVDISVWQDDNSTPQMFDPWKARVMGGSFVGIKVSQADWADPDFKMNWANCRRVLYRLPYHFLVWDKPPKKQAETFWSLLEKDPGELPLTCDFEWWQIIPSNAMDILYNFMERLKQLTAPLPLGIYTNYYFWLPYGSAANYWTQFHLWLCDISGEIDVPPPWTRWTFHQYTFKLRGPDWGAESQDLDGDYYNGTLEEMQREFNLPPLDVVEPEPEKFPYTAAVDTVAPNRLIMRATPAGAEITRLVRDTELIVNGQSGDWLSVTAKINGYVHRNYVRKC